MIDLDDVYLPIENTVSHLASGQTEKLCRVFPHGTLYARRGVEAVTFSWRWTHEGSNSTQVIGVWDSAANRRSTTRSGRGGWSVKGAVKVAEQMAADHERTLAVGGYKAYMEQLEQEQRPQSTEGHWSFGDLLRDYAALLIARGKEGSAVDVRTVIRRLGELHDKAACQVDKADILGILGALNSDEHYRLVVKTRSILKTAFQLAKTAGSTSDTEHFKHYQVVANPVDLTMNPPRSGPARVIKALNQHQLRAYWLALKKAGGVRAAMLSVHLLTGGPRPTQLGRLRTAEITDDYFTLYDIKGRNSTPRPYALPVTPLIRKALDACMPAGEFALSLNGGRTPIDKGTWNDWFTEIAGDVLPGYTLKHVRSGIETLLQRFGVDEKHSGRLQSHGFGGTQDLHYNAYDYYAEKMVCLEIIEWALHDPKAAPKINPLVAEARAYRAAKELA